MKKQRLLLVFHSVYPLFIAALYDIPGVRFIIYLEILGAGRMTYSKLYTENPKY